MIKKKYPKKLVFGVLGTAIIIVVLAIFALLSTTDSETIDNEAKDQREVAIHLVQNFQGIDGKGSTIKESLEIRLVFLHRDNDILDDPDTKLVWAAFQKSDETDNIFEVFFHARTFLENTKYIFYIDLENGEVSSGNNEAKMILDNVNVRDNVG